MLEGGQAQGEPRDLTLVPRCPALLLESPRWLLATLQLERARKTLQALAEDNCPQESLLTGAWGDPQGDQPQPQSRGCGVL